MFLPPIEEEIPFFDDENLRDPYPKATGDSTSLPSPEINSTATEVPYATHSPTPTHEQTSGPGASPTCSSTPTSTAIMSPTPTATSVQDGNPTVTSTLQTTPTPTATASTMPTSQPTATPTPTPSTTPNTSPPPIPTYTPGGPAIAVYYSVGTNANDLKSGSPTLSISSGTATFSVSQPNNIGVGDEIIFNSTQKVYISGRVNSRTYSVITATGTTPANISNAPVNSIRRTFNSLSEAEANASGPSYLNTSNLTADNYQLHFPCYADGLLTDHMHISGWTTGPNNYIRIYTPVANNEVGVSQRHNGTWGTGFRINANFDTFQVGEDYVRIEGIAGSGHDWDVFLAVDPDWGDISASNDIRMSNCLINGNGKQSRPTYLNDPDLNVTIWNTIAYNHEGFNGFYFMRVNRAYCYNCTSYNNDGAGFRRDAGTVIVHNSISMGNNRDFSGVFDASSDYNLTSDDTAPGSNSLLNQVITDQFLSITSGSENLHLKSGATAIGMGRNLSGNFSDDIDGHPRSGNWDIGADEYY
jgi:hypothetical protein